MSSLRHSLRISKVALESGFGEGLMPVADFGRAIVAEEVSDDRTEQATKEFTSTVADDAANGVADAKSAEAEKVHSLSPLAKRRVNGVQCKLISQGVSGRKRVG